MLVIYELGIHLMILVIRFVALFHKKEERLIRGQKENFKRLEDLLDKEGGYIWFHASSLGEFEQGRPVIEAIKREDPTRKILLTFFSPSGFEVRKDYPGADVVAYLPFDLIGNVNHFLNLVKPVKAVFIKYEFWGNYLLQLHKRRIPTYIISAIFREKQIFFRPYGHWFRKLLKCYACLFVQDQQSADRLAAIGIKRVVVCGDTRVDRVIEIMQSKRSFPIIESFIQGKDGVKPKVLVVGSSWPKDENIIIPYFNNRPDLKIIIAPHEIDGFHLDSIMNKLKRPGLRYSQATIENASSADCLIIDCFGLLSSLYQYGDIAYIGGGFGAGIHNTLEAAVYGIPVIFGPNNKKFREARGLLSEKGAMEIRSEADFTIAMESSDWKSAGKAAEEYIWKSQGAAKMVTETLLK